MNAYELNELLNTTPETLAKLQHAALKQHALDVLRAVMTAIKEERYEDTDKLVVYSPAGDNHGRNNFYINFLGKDWDITDVVAKLKILKGM